MQRLENRTPHFIYCIKPNNFQSPGKYEQGLVLQQLRCCGVLEVVWISRYGFPTRMFHQKFARRYGFLLLDHVTSVQYSARYVSSWFHKVVLLNWIDWSS